MISVDVSSNVDGKLRLLARAWGLSLSEVIERLIDEFEAGAPRPAADAGMQQSVAVHAEYQRLHVEGLYDPIARVLEITKGPCQGQRFNTPSAAAIAVVASVNPTVNPNRNGWNFWIITATGKRLQSLRAHDREPLRLGGTHSVPAPG